MSWTTARVCVGEIGQRTVLFSEEVQRLVAVNDAGASLWRRLEAGLSPDEFCAPDEVRAATAQTLEAWAKAGLIRPDGEVAEGEAPRRADGAMTGRTLDIGLASVRLNLCRELAGGEIWPYLAQFPECRRKPQRTLSVHASNCRPQSPAPGLTPAVAQEMFRVRKDDRHLCHCARDEVVPILKAQLTAEVLERGAYVLALHAAALYVRDRLLIVTGPSGTGKSTIAAALLGADLGFAADDLVLLDADGVARGVPFSPGLKQGAWDLLRDMRCDVGSFPVHRRPDGRAVRYVPPGRQVSAARRPVGWVVVLSEGDDFAPKLAPSHPLEAVEVLLAGASAPGDRLTEEGFRALASLVGNARCFRLGRMPLRDAVAALREACS